ncbi:GNAT family N-acetyltransferase [Castellaniella caeni]|uniref:GNAT family N-acetyltransferase n=1 Tax=Castellaniella caeni TaxID=266123 RepID=UPI0018DE3699|nr:GNAT family N-acetyltransferase [Castellaniella caeni]
MEYSIESLSGEAGVQRISKIFEQNQNPKSLDGLRWMYADNSAGGAVSFMATTLEGGDAAVYSIMKVRVILQGVEVMASQSIDTLTDAHHRGKGLFLKLSNAAYNAASADGIAFVYGFPNSNSAPGFFNRLQWVNYNYPPYMFYVNNVFYPIKKLCKLSSNIWLGNFISNPVMRLLSLFNYDKGCSIINISTFKNIGYDSIWNKFSKKLGGAVNRDSEYMEWRFLRKPGFNYKIRGLQIDGDLIAIAVFVVLEKHGGKIGYLMDFIYDPDFQHKAGVLMRSVVREICSMKADVILAWNKRGYINNFIYRRSLFLPLPRLLQPIKLYFGMRWFRSGADCPPFDMDNFYISYADSDTV